MCKMIYLWLKMESWIVSNSVPTVLVLPAPISIMMSPTKFIKFHKMYSNSAF